MAGLKNFGNVLEERQFSNPHIRFVRIRGRVVPIVNKKRVGGDLERVGNSVASAGIKVGVGSALTKAAFKRLRPKFKSINALADRAGAVKGGKLIRGARFLGRHSGKIGVAIAALGLGASLGGAELQMRSKFGRDVSLGGE